MKTLIAGGNGKPTKVMSIINSTTTPLNDGQTYTGTWELNHSDQVMVSCITDTTGTLYFDFSNDQVRTLTFPTNGFKVAAGIHEFHVAVKGGRSFRARFVNNSGSNQTYLELYTYYGDNFVPSNAPLNQNIGLDSDAILTRSTLAQDEIRIGRRSGVAGWTQFGHRFGINTTDGEVVIWANGNSLTPMTSADTFTITYNNATDGLGTTGALTLYVQYVDANGLPAIANHVLGNTGSDVTSFTGLGINRVAVSSSGSAQKNTNDIDIIATTATTEQAIIPALHGVTQQCIYHVGSNHDAVAKFLWFNILRTGGGSSPKVAIKGRVFNRNIQTEYIVFEADIDTSVENTNILEDPIGFNLSPTDVLYFTADTDTNNTDVKLRFSLNEYQRS